MMIKYWNDLNEAPHLQDKLEGLAFSILNALDGIANVPPHYGAVFDMYGSVRGA